MLRWMPSNSLIANITKIYHYLNCQWIVSLSINVHVRKIGNKRAGKVANKVLNREKAKQVSVQEPKETFILKN